MTMLAACAALDATAIEGTVIGQHVVGADEEAAGLVALGGGGAGFPGTEEALRTSSLRADAEETDQDTDGQRAACHRGAQTAHERIKSLAVHCGSFRPARAMHA